MKSAIRLILALFICFPLGAEIMMEHDGADWKVTGQNVSKTDQKLKAVGRGFIADAKTKMRDAAPLLEETKQVQAFTIRMALRDQEGKGGVFSPLPTAAKNKGLLTIITCDPRGFDAGCVQIAEQVEELQVFETGRMGPDFEGLEKFLDVLKAGVKRANDEETPAVASIVVRSESSWGQMVRMVQMLNSVGFRHGVLRIDDTFAGLDVEVKQDPRVTTTHDKEQADPSGPQVPTQIGPDRPKTGRIVINIFDDGTLKDVNGKILASDDEITQYVKQEKEQLVATGHAVCKLHLRGEKDSLISHSRRAIRLAVTVGVDQVIFAGYTRPAAAEPDKGTTPPRE